jgi:1-deoxy-D-xylulose-5-phosphate synthase
MALLDGIHSPQDLKQLPPESLPRLAEEIRELIVHTCSENGGHLAPSLGAVELTLALHTVFDAPRDRIVWDVGHQAYAHKILTGRRDRFATLRQYGGISGFPRRVESPYDVFGTAHGSTAISAALGFAAARDLAGEDHHVVAVVGDGAMTGGLAYEGLNNAGGLKKNLLVILNDNRFSISPNVGGIAHYLTRITAAPVYRELEKDAWKLLGKLPALGREARNAASRLKRGLKRLTIPDVFFEEMGFQYFGPVDGHDLRGLVSILRELKSIPGPVFLHVRTVKGKGYEPAEMDACAFHGLGKFDKVTGKAEKSASLNYTNVFGETALELAAQHPRLVAITAAMADGTGLARFRERYPERFFDAGMAEAHAVCFAAGLAAAGAIPLVAIYSTFLQRAFDQIVHDVALQGLHVVFCVDRAGLVGEDGPTHHGVFDIGTLRQIPGVVVMQPRDENELVHMLHTAVAHHEGPVVVRYPRAAIAGVERAAPRVLEIGRGELLRPGTDVALVALGSMVQPSLEAAQELAKTGIRAAVFDARFAHPVDAAAIAQLARLTGRLVTVEEHELAGGFGSAVVEALEQAGAPPVPVRRLGVPHEFIHHGSRAQLLEQIGLTAPAIAAEVRAFLASALHQYS